MIVVYFKQSDDPTYLLLYVDMLIATRNKTHVHKLKDQPKKEFDMKDLEEAKKILGMKIARDRLRQTLAIPEELWSQGVGEIQHDRVSLVTTPLAGHFKLSSKQCLRSLEEEEVMSRVRYASAVGSLMYAMVCLGLT